MQTPFYRKAMKKFILFTLFTLCSFATYSQKQTFYVVSMYHEENEEVGIEAGYRPLSDILEVNTEAKTAKLSGQKFKLGAVKRNGASTYYTLLVPEHGTEVVFCTFKVTGNDMLMFTDEMTEKNAYKYKLGSKEQYEKAHEHSSAVGVVSQGINEAVQSVSNLFKQPEKKGGKKK